jgi:hypothetical protein
VEPKSSPALLLWVVESWIGTVAAPSEGITALDRNLTAIWSSQLKGKENGCSRLYETVVVTPAPWHCSKILRRWRLIAWSFLLFHHTSGTRETCGTRCRRWCEKLARNNETLFRRHEKVMLALDLMQIPLEWEYWRPSNHIQR